MKKLLLIALGASLSSFAFGQGQIAFLTRGGVVNAPITNGLTGALASGATYMAQLYYGAQGSDPTTFRTFTNAPATFSATLPGYILSASGGGPRTVDSTYAPGAVLSWQVRAWEAVLGANYDTALQTWNSTSDANYGKVVLGKSAVFDAKTSATATEVPQPLSGLTGFSMQIVPEPSVIALGLIGLAALVWRRRQ